MESDVQVLMHRRSPRSLASRYVAKENKNLYMTELGEVVNNIMKQAFPSIVDVNFTANMESLLDKVEEGVVNWKTVVSNFYPDLDEAVEDAEKELEKVKIEDEVTDVVCEECGRNMVIKYGPHGRFLACPGFPECRNTKPYLEKIGVACPKCGKDIVLRKTKKGRKYYGCENNPDCDFMSWQKPSQRKMSEMRRHIWLRREISLSASDEACGYIENKFQRRIIVRNFHARKAKKAAVCSFFALNILKIQKNYDKLKICQE